MNKNPIVRISHGIERLYSTSFMSALLIAFVGFFWLFNFSPLPLSNPELIKLSGHEGLLDLMPFYTAQEAYAAMSNYGPAGRELYLRFLRADFIFIPIYSLGFAFLMTRTVRAVCDERSAWSWLNVLPVGIGLFDCMENLSIFGVLSLYPAVYEVLGALAGISTLFKHIFTLLTLLALGYGGVVLILRQCGLALCGSHQR